MFSAVSHTNLQALLDKMTRGVKAPHFGENEQEKKEQEKKEQEKKEQEKKEQEKKEQEKKEEKIQDDQRYITAIKAQWKPTIDDAQIAKFRGLARVKQFRAIFTAVGYVPQHGSNYLDFGAAGGELSRAIGKYFKVITHATDVASWHGSARPQDIDTKFFKYKTLDKNGKIPFVGKKFKIISCLMVLHHIKNWEQSLDNIVQHLAPDGILVIREHDANTEEVVNMCHLEHLIHSCVFENQTLEEFKKDYYGDYKAVPTWRDQIIKRHPHLECIYGDTPNGPTRYSFMAFRFSAVSRAAK